jgi:hypothetical protein
LQPLQVPSCSQHVPDGDGHLHSVAHSPTTRATKGLQPTGSHRWHCLCPNNVYCTAADY